MIDVHRPLTPAIEAELRETLGAELRRLRRAAGLTQAQTARRANLTTPYVSHLEHGRRRPSRQTLHRLALALDVHSPGLTWTTALADRLEDLTGPHMAGKTEPRPARDPARAEALRADLETLRGRIRRAYERLEAEPHFDELRLMAARAEAVAEDMAERLEWLTAHPVTGAPA